MSDVNPDASRRTGDASARSRAERGVLIECDGVSKRYATQRGGEVVALAEADFSIAEGEFITCVGPSGCGKTTLLRMLGGLVSPTTGSIRLRGTPVTTPRPEISVVAQQAVLLPWRTALQNVMLPVEIQRLNKKTYGARALELLRTVGLEAFTDKYPFELSGGMQQRNSIARALVTDPKILLMDEPFAALDAMTREEMAVELQRIWLESQKAVFFITHSISEAVYLGDRVIVLSARPGRILTIVDVDLERPRGVEVMASPEFGAYAGQIRKLLEHPERSDPGHRADEDS
ncbi:MAG TPA: ABC transporter ATP-binding protein [Thermomicrobiales bacterium]|nr:ABC transporter ATP-binding protein [Thermomicrobiales bacterium]